MWHLLSVFLILILKSSFYFAQKLPGREQSTRIYHIEGELGEKNENAHMGQISYTHSYNPSESRGTIILTIDKVQLSDESEITCMVKDNHLTDHGEGHTQLQVFSKFKWVHLNKPGTVTGRGNLYIFSIVIMY